MSLHVPPTGRMPRLVIMAKRPAAGRVKTRLAADIGVVSAACFYRHMLASTLRRLGSDPRWHCVLAVAPDEAVSDKNWPDGCSVMPQGPGDLGARMGRVMSALPPGPVVIIGSDIPAISPADIAGAFNQLGRHDAVFGPAPDGGYWLVGQKRMPATPHLFDNVRWSSPHTLSDTLENTKGLSVAMLAERCDVDTVEAYRLLRDTASRLIPCRV